MKYYIYAGYYEIYITEKKIGDPYVYLGYSTSIDKAIRRAENGCGKVGEPEAIIISQNIYDEVGFGYPQFNPDDYPVK